ncbi:DUF1654 domain-containing protein [Pseudomonas kuykendallii]|uniref:DUF1654 domain-containing protein n=1 Tax=Pseudomonas kuykendallii TaxID=1007099 RepID=A0A1H3EN17_9PSED|nr:DUF1654 domain-containing protein [Pseudomonas kuykendallii]MCQ4271044.1 DUF1654 domain-containing protein [Pseudomonas kuykendallii]SDX79558.1 Protein of unknown function [Pseudomonas kuykendallii]
MAKQKGRQEQKPLTASERLGLRVSAMINSPRAQEARSVTIHRMDYDDDEAWTAVMELIAENDEVTINQNEDGSVTLCWGLPSDYDVLFERKEFVPLQDEAPF